MTRWRCIVAVLALSALTPAGCGRVSGDGAAVVAEAAPELSPGEIELARQLAEQQLALPATPLSPSERVYFIRVDRIPDVQAQTGQRQAVVVHYRYLGDETILTTVDLNRLEVLKIEVAAHFPTGLAPEEERRAEELARADERLKALFGTLPGLQIDFRPTTHPAPSDPFHGHRMVHLLLHERGSYLRSPQVVVNLTTEAVLVDE